MSDAACLESPVTVLSEVASSFRLGSVLIFSAGAGLLASLFNVKTCHLKIMCAISLSFDIANSECEIRTDCSGHPVFLLRKSRTSHNA